MKLSHHIFHKYPEFHHQQLNIPVASIEPRAYAMADGAAAIELAKKLLG